MKFTLLTDKPYNPKEQDIPDSDEAIRRELSEKAQHVGEALADTKPEHYYADEWARLSALADALDEDVDIEWDGDAAVVSFAESIST